MTIQTMSEAYPNGYLGNGIFLDLQATDVPWKSLNINGSLDGVYYAHSGDKYVTKIIRKSIVNNSLPLPARESIAEMVYTIFGDKWSKIWAAMELEYNPISNYDMTENESIGTENSNTIEDTGTLNKDATNSHRDTGTIETAATNSRSDSGTIDREGTIAEIENGVYGFNSAITPVDSDKSVNSTDTTETHDLTYGESLSENVERDLTYDDDINETETHNLKTETSGETNTTRQLTRSGNIGVTTSQQLLQSEIELRGWLFFEDVFNDIDSILCLSVY